LKPWGSVASLLDALAEEADSEAAAIREEAAAEAALMKEHESSQPVDIPDGEVRLASARREAAEALAREDWEDRRAALEDREAWIQRAAGEGLARLQGSEGLDPALLTRLVLEASRQMPGQRLSVLVPPANGHGPRDDRWREAVRAAGADLDSDAPAESRPASGCIVRTADGRALFDNTFEARARRLESLWRNRLVGIYPP
jgi:vacuolar-type H+-ATPase subunit E/Vma4